MRKFGIELEMVSPRNGDALAMARDVIVGTGTQARTNSYSGRDYDQWQVKSDGSIQPFGRGAEVVSRVMPANVASYDEITRVVSALDNAGFGVNRSCGFHVHLNVADLSHVERQLVILRYGTLQRQISAMLPPSRRANGYCAVLSDNELRQLTQAIDGGASYVPGTRGVCNTAHMGTGSSSRIEFRQAAGTVNPGKVVGWVKFLQEMIDEVVRRARADGVRFGRAPITVGVPVIRPVPVAPAPMPVARIPNMRAGSDADRALTQLCTHGAITAAWAGQNGIGENVLRRIIVGFRRHGAQLDTLRTDNGPTYVLTGTHALPVARERVFASQPVAVPAPAPVAVPAPVAPPAPAITTARTFIAYPFEAGLSVETMAWVRDRRDTFNASEDAAA